MTANYFTPAMREKLIARRHKLRWTRTYLASRINVSPDAMRLYEEGSRVPNINSLGRWTEGLGMEFTITITERGVSR